MTHVDVDYAALEAGLKRFLAEQFERVEILSVKIEEDIDLGEEDRILEISVVFQGTPQELAEHRPIGLNSRLQDELVGLDAPAFPVLNFIPCPAS